MTDSRAQTAVGSLAWLFLLGLITLAVGGLVYLAFDESLSFFFDRPEWRPSSAESGANPADIARGQRTLEVLWSAVPALIVTAVALSLLIRARRARG